MNDIHEDIKINNMFTEIIFDLNNLQEIESMTYHINYLKKICKIYMNLSLDEIKQIEEQLQKILIIVNENKNLPIKYKKDLLNILKKMKKIIVRLTVNTIINYI